MVNKLSIGTTITATKVPLDKLYVVLDGNVPSVVYFVPYTSQGVQITDDIIETVKPAALFFDSESSDIFYCLNSNQKIAQYNFETKELDVLPDQTQVPWQNNIFIERQQDGNFISSDFGYDPGIGDTVTFMQRYALDGTLIEQETLVLSWFPGDLTTLGIIECFSTNGTHTVIKGSSLDAVIIGIPTYSASGLLIGFEYLDEYPNETGGTIHDGNLYTLNGSIMLVRDLAEINPTIEIPIQGFAYGNIGKVKSLSPESITGLLTSIDITKTTTNTIADAWGSPVLFTEPGNKFIELTVTDNLDIFLDSEVELLFIEGEQFEIKSIVATNNLEYEVTLQTPELS